MFGTYLHVVKTTLKIVFNTQQDSDESLIASCALNNMSYRLPRAANFDRLIGVRVWLRFLKSLKLKSGTGIITRVPDNPNWFMTTHEGGWKIAVDYVEYCSKHSMGTVVYKDYLSGELKHKLPIAIFHSLLAIAISVVCVFSKKRSNIAALIREIPEMTALLHAAKKGKAERFYNFCSKEKDAGIISYLMQEIGVWVILIPAAGPLKTHNHTLYGDEVILCNPYQFEEFEMLKKNMRVKKVTRWIPERTNEYIANYMQGLSTSPKTLGLYSHGSWLREMQNHADNGLNLPEAEAKLIQDLAQFMGKHSDFTLTIFAHPKEKKPDVFESTKAFYEKHFDFKSGRVFFSEPNKSTASAFDKIDIALSAFSTIQYERLFCGYKTLIGAYTIPDFPLSGSPLEKICIRSYHDLERMVLAASEETAADFLRKNGIENYCYKSMPREELPF
jgi:hypothetical protein